MLPSTQQFWWVFMQFFLSLVLTLLVVAAHASSFKLGDQIRLRDGDQIPSSDPSTLWVVKSEIQNATFFEPSSGGVGSNILVLELVTGAREPMDGKILNPLVGSTLWGGGENSQHILKLTEDRHFSVVLYHKFVVLLADHFKVGQLHVDIGDTRNLPWIAIGYEWREVSRVSGVTTLIPSVDGKLKSAGDSVTYQLHKMDPSLSDTFKMPRIETVFASSQSEAEQRALAKSGVSSKPQRGGGICDVF